MKRKPWTQKEIDFLVEHYANEYSANLAVTLQRPLRAIYGMANKLGLKKTKEFVAAAGRMSCNHPNVVATRLKKGNIPPNKGMKMSDAQREKLAHTWFKKGHLQINTKKPGTITKRACGYWWIRISINNWRQLHTYTWEQANRPIDPKTEMVKFRDGNNDNCSLENLYLSTRAENMKTNTIQRYPEEVKQAIRTISSLNKVIKKHEE